MKFSLFSKKYFFGWSNIRFGIKELIKIGSNKPSFFSKKRVESGIAFGVLIWGCIFWLVKKYEVMTTTDFLLWCTVPAAIAGVILVQIEKAKERFSNLHKEEIKDELPKE